MQPILPDTIEGTYNYSLSPDLSTRAIRLMGGVPRGVLAPRFHQTSIIYPPRRPVSGHAKRTPSKTGMRGDALKILARNVQHGRPG